MDSRNVQSNEQSNELKKRILLENWRREMEAVQLYELAGKREDNSRKRDILKKLAQIELDHAKLWEGKLSEMGSALEQLPSVQKAQSLNKEELLKRIFDIEQSNATWYQSQRNLFSETELVSILDRIDKDEAEHESTVDSLSKESYTVTNVLHTMWGAERWHKQQAGGWVGDAIYGVNDGLGAIFGIIAGVAGYSANNSHLILVSGFFGALASTLSMGAGAWLATKSENELMESEIEHERREIMEDPEHEIEELSLLYQLKGFSEEESNTIANRIAEDQEQFVKTMAQEELGFHEASEGNPWKSAVYGCISTFVGGIIPLLPFFFLTGIPAIVAAAVVSILAHFAVGAAKSVITVRSWLASGLEMTAVGIIVGVVSYGLGLIGTMLIHV